MFSSLLSPTPSPHSTCIETYPRKCTSHPLHNASQPQKCTSHTLTSTKMHIKSTHIYEKCTSHPQTCTSHPHTSTKCTSNPLTSTKVHITSLKGTFHTPTFTKIHITSAHIHKNAHHILFTVESRLQKSTSHPQTWPHHACDCTLSA